MDGQGHFQDPRLQFHSPEKMGFNPNRFLNKKTFDQGMLERGFAFRAGPMA
jgi:hypothetical protein